MQTIPSIKLANVDTDEESSVVIRIFGDSVFFLNEAGETLMNVEVYNYFHGTLDEEEEDTEMIRVFVSNSNDFDEYSIPTKKGAA
jgi:hypothetical protein